MVRVNDNYCSKPVDKQNKTSFYVVNIQFISGGRIFRVSLKVVVLQSGRAEMQKPNYLMAFVKH